VASRRMISVSSTMSTQYNVARDIGPSPSTTLSLAATLPPLGNWNRQGYVQMGGLFRCGIPQFTRLRHLLCDQERGGFCPGPSQTLAGITSGYMGGTASAEAAVTEAVWWRLSTETATVPCSAGKILSRRRKMGYSIIFDIVIPITRLPTV
jgi:hypothetical protein